MPQSTQAKAYVALVAVCFFWGTTYLGIRMALESMPPALLMGVRFTLSGLVLVIASLLTGAELPRGREFWWTAWNGIVVLGAGTGCLVYAEQIIPSGLAALIITAAPFWFVGIEAVRGGEPVHGPTAAAMLIGFAGAALLVGPDAIRAGFSSNILHGFLILQFASLCWCWGSISQRRLKTKAHPVVSGGVQQLAAGLAFLIPTLVTNPHPAMPTWKSGSAVLYLVVFGSVVGYSAFIFAMEHLPVAVVTIYNYVNPVVAVFLGWLFYREPFGPREAVAMLVIFAGVAMVKWATAASARAKAQQARAL
ncbi:MAG: EamA family transporter [Bryobacteraceae bacterium]